MDRRRAIGGKSAPRGQVQGGDFGPKPTLLLIAANGSFEPKADVAPDRGSGNIYTKCQNRVLGFTLLAAP